MNISIKTLDDAYKAKGINPTDCNITIAGLPEKYHTAIIAFASLVVIADAINEEVSPGWKPDWQDYNQDKWYPWFEMDNSASGFSFHAALYYYSGSNVGSRLCFCSREAARYAGQQFVELYKQLMVLE